MKATQPVLHQPVSGFSLSDEVQQKHKEDDRDDHRWTHLGKCGNPTGKLITKNQDVTNLLEDESPYQLDISLDIRGDQEGCQCQGQHNLSI